MFILNSKQGCKMKKSIIIDGGKMIILRLSEYIECRQKILYTSQWNAIRAIYSDLRTNINSLSGQLSNDGLKYAIKDIRFNCEKLRPLVDLEMFIDTYSESLKRLFLLLLIDIVIYETKK